MKLRNKKTGEIGHFTSTNWNEIALIIMDDNGVQLAKYSSLAELNAEWEDYEEPKEPKEPKESKEYWFINSGGETVSYYEEDEEPEDTEAYKEIGNYFDSREEAEKVVERLRAWKRLKDKGFIIYSWDYEFDMVDKPAQTIILRASAVDSSNTDLDLLFGGKE